MYGGGFHGRSPEDQQQPEHGACRFRVHQRHGARRLPVAGASSGIGRSQRLHQSGGDAPFGGVRESGIGREGGTEMYHSYTVAKTIAERRVKV
ncbi:aldehyde dehydrogenase family protein (plasmid) [Rhizobium ruizarguesonis]|nr:aldehyde dehydrogenase family protein [Rhizobium ruizarguesonis]